MFETAEPFLKEVVGSCAYANIAVAKMVAHTPVIALIVVYLISGLVFFTAAFAAADVEMLSDPFVNDPDYTLRVRVNGEERTEKILLKEGPNTISRTYAAPGGEVTLMQVVTLDRRPPLIEALRYPRVTREEAVTVHGLADGRPFAQTHLIPGPDGFYSPKITARDAAGNENFRHIRILKDTRPPRAKLNYPRETSAESVTIRGFIDGRPFEETHPLKGPPGVFVLFIRLKDEAGNEKVERIQIKKTSPGSAKSKISALVLWAKSALGGKTNASSGPVAPSAGGPVRVSEALGQLYDRMAAQEGQALTGPALVPDAPAAMVSREGQSHYGEPLGENALVALPGRPARHKEVAKRALVAVEKPDGRQPAPPAGGEEPAEATGIIHVSGSGEKAADARGVVWTEASDASATKIRGIRTTQVRYPDEYGGITLTIDDYGTGRRTVIRKDRSGNETAREVVPMPVERKKGKKKADSPETQK